MTSLAETGLIPDSVIRFGVRQLINQRRAHISADDIEQSARDLSVFVAMMEQSEVAIVPDVANQQHYEVPAEFFAQVLGTQRKYSCCYWAKDTENLDSAEQVALKVTAHRALIEDGQAILDLGCGWGSFSLYAAQHYPSCRITSVSNSASQRRYIMETARERGLSNIEVITADMNEFEAPSRYDRIVSVEMFEHMRNYGELYRRIANWLTDDGYFFKHIFCHRSCAYEYVDAGPGDWMSRHFFSGGIMPGDSLPLHFQNDLTLQKHWRWNGKHYQKTAEAWLSNMDSRREEIMPILERVYGKDNAQKWWMRWRIFFMAVSELFGFKDGSEWWVSHYLFSRRNR
ncbi:MAG: cyclopropane-fatty-acyl-phospholipid synthase family protein [Gammaproteobacteria bacterium]|nr:cyclopropane-fatty-acyl-phospholipid synthase family protein [Gammaproteobacteria bacterium]